MSACEIRPAEALKAAYCPHLIENVFGFSVTTPQVILQPLWKECV